MSYKETLNLPKTSFPMKGNLAANEPRFLRYWEEIGLYHKLVEKNQGKESFILHDGPPYANGDIHLGHTLNKVLKDIVVRYHLMRGFYAPFVPGWDCHGQPIEYEVEKRLNRPKAEIPKEEFRRLCREYARTFIERQKEEFKRLGILGDWENPYLTMDPVYEASVVRVFGEMYFKGLVYRGLKPIFWCYRCETALAEAEIEYQDKESDSITVKLPFADNPWGEKNVFLLIWTTTPWTLPANVAVALHPEANYVLVESGEEKYVLAETLARKLFPEAQFLKTAKGSDFQGRRVSHPIFSEKTSLIVVAPFVSLEQGTGAVHIAPGHGEEDFSLKDEFDLEVVMPVDDRGRFTAEAGKYEGMVVDEANEVIVNDLKEKGLLLKRASITHSYPHCWRCKKPVIFRATEQWFLSMEKENFRQQVLKLIPGVKWIPAWSINRITAMVRERPDWCLSRQRSWGVPLPVFYCHSCQKEVVTRESIEAVASLFEKEGADSWFKKEVREILPTGFSCPHCGAQEFIKEDNIFDVWFESGSSHEAVLKNRPELSWPASLYLEGSDQHRGWFQTSLLVSVAVNDAPPYKAVLTHGFTVDDKGRKMSKSLGNVVDPLNEINRVGADVLRLWVVSTDYSKDAAASSEILDKLGEVYRRFRNTFRFLLGNLYDFEPSQAVPYEELLELDRYALLRLTRVVAQVDEAFKNYRFHQAYKILLNYFTNDLSSFYLDVLKDRLYVSQKSSLPRRSAQTVLLEILLTLSKLLAPFLPFTTEEVWSHLKPEFKKGIESVHLADWPAPKAAYLNPVLEKRWEKIISLREEVLKRLEEAREANLIRDSLEAKIVLEVDQKDFDFYQGILPLLEEVLIVSQMEIGLSKEELEEGEKVIMVKKAEGKKCERCWKYHSSVGKISTSKELCSRCLSVIEKFEEDF